MPRSGLRLYYTFIAISLTFLIRRLCILYPPDRLPPVRAAYTSQPRRESWFANPFSGKSHRQHVLRPGDIPLPSHDDTALYSDEPEPDEPGGVVGSLRNVRYFSTLLPLLLSCVQLCVWTNEKFYRDPRFYQGGLLTLTNHTDQSHPMSSLYDPYPRYNSPDWQKSWIGHFSPCDGPRGKPLDRANYEDMMSVYRGTQEGDARLSLSSLCSAAHANLTRRFPGS